MDFYDKLKSYKAVNGLKWSDIGRIIDKNETTVRIAIKRRSLSKYEIEIIEKEYGIGNNAQSKTSKLQEETETYNIERSFEERIAEAVAKKLAPDIQQIKLALAESILDIDDIKDLLKIIKKIKS